MPRQKSYTFNEVELKFMQAVWAKNEASSEEIQVELCEQGHSIVGGAVRRVLTILMEKGHLTRRRVGRRYIYKSIHSKEHAEIFIVQDILRRVFDGSVINMMAAVLNINNLKSSDIKEIKRIISVYEKKQKK